MCLGNHFGGEVLRAFALRLRPCVAAELAKLEFVHKPVCGCSHFVLPAVESRAVLTAALGIIAPAFVAYLSDALGDKL